MSIGSDARKKKDTSETRTSQRKDTDLTSVEKLNIDEEGVLKIIEDILGSGQGLASIFGGEQATGLYNSTVAKEQGEDLATKVVGEIARLTAERETTKRGSETLQGDQRTDTKEREFGIESEFNLGL